MTASALRDLTPLALAETSVGVWERDPMRGVVRCDATAAWLYGLSEAEGIAGVTLERLGAVIHPDDRSAYHGRYLRAAHKGTLVVNEYRVIPAPGVVRWVLVRGLYQAPRPGQAMAGGRGIVIDITDGRPDTCAGAGAYRLAGSMPTVADGVAEPIHQATDLALGAHALLQSVEGNGRLLAASRFLLEMLGLHLARGASNPSGRRRRDGPG